MTPQTKIRVLLIDPGTDRDEINEPLGICCIASYAREFIGEFIDVQLKFYPLSEPVTRDEIENCDVLGISAKIKSLKKIKQVYEIFIEVPEKLRPVLVYGDLIATFATRQLLEICPQAICVKGEGEEALVGIIKSVLDRGTGTDGLREMLLRRNVPNLEFYCQGEIVNTQRALVDLKTCPLPDRSFAPTIKRRGGVIRVECSRGCAWGECTFCAIQSKYCNEIEWRGVEIDRIVCDLEQLASIGVKNPFFTDEDFLGGTPSRSIALAEAIITGKKNGRIDPELNFYADARIDSILQKEGNGHPSGEFVLRKLKQAGLREVFIGIESGVKGQIKRYKKPTTVSKSIRVLKILKNLGITTDIGFIMFDPEMTLDELSANVQFIRDTGLIFHNTRLTKSLRVEAGTPLVEKYKKKNLIAGELDIDELIFPFNWLHSDVGAVCDAFSEWEKLFMDQVYSIQAATRGEVENEDIRKEWNRGLGRIRNVEIEALEHLVNQAREGVDPSKVSLGRFSKRKEELVRTMEKKTGRF